MVKILLLNLRIVDLLHQTRGIEHLHWALMQTHLDRVPSYNTREHQWTILHHTWGIHRDRDKIAMDQTVIRNHQDTNTAGILLHNMEINYLPDKCNNNTKQGFTSLIRGDINA
jgi:hypothetical protein